MKLLMENWRQYLKEDKGSDVDNIIKLLKNPQDAVRAQAIEFLSLGIVNREEVIEKLWDIILAGAKKEEARVDRLGRRVGPGFKDNMDYYYIGKAIATFIGACDPYCHTDFIPRNKYTPTHSKYGDELPMFKRHSNTWNFEEFREMFEGKMSE